MLEASGTRTRPPVLDFAAMPAAVLSYSIFGEEVTFTSNVEHALTVVDGTYAAFRSSVGADAYAFRLHELAPEDTFVVTDSSGMRRACESAELAAVVALGELVTFVLRRLHRRGILAVHAAAAVHDGRSLVIAGPSGHGKTTLAVGLVSRGLRLLSDELALVDPGSGCVLPYPRSIHVRPDTVDLIPALDFLRERPKHHLGGGIEWAVPPGELELVFPGCLGTAAPLAAAVILDGIPDGGRPGELTPISPAVAAMELLRGTWAASVDLPGSLARVASVLGEVRCARLQVGDLEETLDGLLAWLGGGEHA